MAVVSDTSPLSGIRVIELSQYISGPFAGQLLADMGAEVIKVEAPGKGDPFRRFDGKGISVSPHFIAFNRSKKSVTVDLKNSDEVASLTHLIQDSDVVLENFRPGVLHRFGLGFEDLSEVQPQLIYCSVTGFGSSGPYVERPAFDTIAQSLSGLLSQTLDPEDPKLVGPAFADSIAGLYAANAILGAIVGRRSWGAGVHVEVSMLGATLNFLSSEASVQSNTDIAPTPEYRPAASQSFVFRCTDGRLVSVHLSSPEKFWVGLTRALGCPDLVEDPRFADRLDRISNYQELRTVLSDRVARLEFDDVVERLRAEDVPFAPVLSMEQVLVDPQVEHMGLVTEQRSRPDASPVVTIGPAARYVSKQPPDLVAPPELGQHNYLLDRSDGGGSTEVRE